MNVCKQCGGNLVVKQTQQKATQLTQPYYYTAYYFCQKCHRIYHDEKFKITNSSSSQNNIDSPTLYAQETKQMTDLVLSPRTISVEVEIWTDGACTNNGNEKAKASWAFVSGEHEEAGLVEGKQTNNRGEAYAIFYALQWAAKKGFTRIKIHTDSQISIFGVTKHFMKVKANQDIFRQIAELITEYNLRVIWQKVLGHSGDINNERVDRLANGLVSS